MTAIIHKGAAFAYEQLTVSTSIVQLTQATFEPANDRGANRAVIVVESGEMRYVVDETTVSATVGTLVDATAATEPVVIYIEGKGNIGRFRAIRDAAADALLSITYERGGPNV